ncbi:MAG: glycosyltransferase [Alphaproteobacteria bacterium]|nr:glycosyltransferase [Alphaproteobacteria bacterium]MDP6817598.1 glycosyltransferase [Alphaproteobacteria bacterium]
MAGRNPRTVYCHHTEPGYIPPPRLSDNMVTVGPFMENVRDGARIQSIKSPKGRYDLAALLKALPGEQAPEAIIVSADATALNEPTNLAAFDCPKVALLADTHHLARPLRNALAYLADEAFDFHIALYNLHHAHFFTEYGLANLHWLPGLTVTQYDAPRPSETVREIIFAGQRGKYHPRRNRMLDAIEAHGHPLRVVECPARQAAALYTRARITLNCSLNGDLNMRVHEALGAGGFLLTDKLSPQSGMDRLFRDGEHLVLYESPDGLIEKIEHYLDRPDAAAAIARRGHEHYMQCFSAERMIARLWDILFGGKPDPLSDIGIDRRTATPVTMSRDRMMVRAKLYEFVQELHRVEESVSVLVLPGVDPHMVSDIADLARVELYFSDADKPDEAARALFMRAGVAAQLRHIGEAEARNASWDVLIAPADLADRIKPAKISDMYEFGRLVRVKPPARADADRERLS